MNQTILINKSHKTLEELLPGLKGKKLIVKGSHFGIKELYRKDEGISSVSIPPGLITPQSIGNAIKEIQNQPDILIAVGGGRIIDAAKLIIREAGFPRPIFLAIPTTAGSGSEATPFAVMYVNGVKQSVESLELLPDIAILDPWYLSGLDQLQKADSAFDALAQAIESFWNRRADDHSRVYARQALQMLVSNIPEYVNAKGDPAKVLWAAHLSGKAIALTRTTACHALSYYLTARHGISHGQAVSIFLPVFFHYNKEADLLELLHLMKAENTGAAAGFVQDLMKACGLATSFKELKIEVDIDEMIQSVNAERFANNPLPFDEEKLKSLIIQYLV